MKEKLKDIILDHEDWAKCFLFIACLVVISIPLIIHIAKNLTNETHYEKGIVLDRNRLIRTDVTCDSEGNTHINEYICYETQIKIISDGYVFIDKSPHAYEHTVVGENVDVKVTVTYWKGKYHGTTYNVR